MNYQEFESQFPDFYVDFGYKATGQLPSTIGDQSANDLETLAAIAREHANNWSYFIVLFWRSLEVCRIPCTKEQYDNCTVTEEIITAAKNYNPPKGL